MQSWGEINMQIGITCTHAALSILKVAKGKGLRVLSDDCCQQNNCYFLVEFQGDDTQAEGAKKQHQLTEDSWGGVAPD